MGMGNHGESNNNEVFSLNLRAPGIKKKAQGGKIMKYAVLLGDGMSDEPMAELDGRTPLMVAATPNLDRMVEKGVGGWNRNTPDGFSPGSDVAILGVLGYDVTTGYTGRSPLEAAAMGVELAPGDVAFRCNLVTLAGRGEEAVMDSFSADHISSAEAAELIAHLQRNLGSERFSFHPGVSYRHLLVWHGGSEELDCTPPHDISDRPITGHLPRGAAAEPILELTRASWELLAEHPVNRARRAAGNKPATSIWLWGQGRRPRLEGFTRRHHKTGGMISAVDLMRGIAVNIGLEVINVPGATGWIDTNYAGKAAACIEGFKRHDFMFVHVEAPDEAGHAGRLDYKIQAIEDFDARIVGPVLAHLESLGTFRAVALPDHPTPVALKTHTRERVPFALCGSGILPDANTRFDERLLEQGSRWYDPGHRMMTAFLAP